MKETLNVMKNVIRLNMIRSDKIECDIKEECLGLPTAYGPLQSLDMPKSLLRIRQTRIQKTRMIICITF